MAKHIWFAGSTKGFGGESRSFTERVAALGDLASFQMQEGRSSIEEFDLRGITNADNAQTACSRRLAALSYPLATFRVSANRVAGGFRPGTPFKFSWSKLGVSGLIARVRNIGGGTLGSGKVTITAQEDVFGATWLGSNPPPGSGWEEPSGDIQKLVAFKALQAPYETVKGLTGGTQYALIMGIRAATGETLGYDAYLQKPDESSWYDPLRVRLLTPAGVLYSSLDETSAQVIVAAGTDFNRVESVSAPAFASGENLLWVVTDDGVEEFIAFQDVSGTSVLTLSGLARGCLDTAPTAFDAGVRVWFVSYGYDVLGILDPEPPSTSRTNVIRGQAFNRDGGYDFEGCDDSELDATTPARADKIYCPTAVLFNGESYPEEIAGELTVSWVHRNRLGTWSYATSGAAASAESGTEYDILVYGEGDGLVHTETGVTGTSWTYDEADEISESGLSRLNNHLRIVIRTYGDSRAHQAIREIEWEVDRRIFGAGSATGAGTATCDGSVE